MAFTKCEESKRACYKILSELPQGDTQLLMARIQAIEAFPDNKSTSVKPINLRDDDKIRKSCTACKFKGHLVTECWGKCKYCGKYGHKSNLCRHKPNLEESKPDKKAHITNQWSLQTSEIEKIHKSHPHLKKTDIKKQGIN